MMVRTDDGYHWFMIDVLVDFFTISLIIASYRVYRVILLIMKTYG